MDVLTGAFQILAGVVVVGGVAKIAAPAGFSSLLRTLGLPSGRALSRLSGVIEVALGTAAFLSGGRIAALALAAAYAVFALVVVAARRAGAESCGCFGAVSTPPSTVHVVVNGLSATVALLAAIASPTSLSDTLAGQPLGGVVYLIAVATAVWLTVVLDTTGAQVVDGIADVARLRPTFREHAGAASISSRAGRRVPTRAGDGGS